MPGYKPEPSLGDKLIMIPNLLRAIANGLARLITSPITGGPKPDSMFRDTIFALVRTHMTLVNPRTEQWLKSTTEAIYLKFAAEKKFQPDTDVLKSGLKVHWLGGKKSEKVILYFHGGGYVLPAYAGQLRWMSHLQTELSKKTSVSVAMPGYTLAPEAQYPSQVQQAVESLEWLIEVQGVAPRNIIVAGDSAGGNMALALLSHLLHPHPEVQSKIHERMSEPLAAALLISPWTKFPTDDASVQRNANSDYVAPVMATRWASLFMGDAQLDNYNQPIWASTTWFNDLESRVKEILVWGGGHELMIDSIQKITQKLKESHPKVDLIVQADGAHEDFMMEAELGYGTDGEQTKLVADWVEKRI